VTEGHVCLNLNQVDLFSRFSIDIAEPQQLEQRLLASNVVGKEGEFTPLVLNDTGQLYLYRYWQHEQDVAYQLKRRSENSVDVDITTLMADFADWHTDSSETDWQKVAVLMAMTQGLSVISGGPGTGKTTIVKKVLGFLHHQNPAMRIALAAPTGKAATRLQQSIQDSEFNCEVKTLHRLLGITADNEAGRYSAERHLAVDLLIIDEASMIDISLMAKVLVALPDKARLLLLGDSQQLASVESGAALASLCEQPEAFTPDFVELAQQCGIQGLLAQQTERFLTNQLVTLKRSYRFSSNSVIWQLANKVNTGDIDGVFSVLTDASCWHQPNESKMLEVLVSGYAGFIDSVESKQDPLAVLAQFEQFRLLAALKRGPHSVESVEHLMHQYLGKRGWKTAQDFYHGRPIMISQNDYRQHLFNGDIGVVLRDNEGQLSAFFAIDNALKVVPLNRLPAHDTAFAMTIHKSQGSEFEHVAVLLPDVKSPVLNRELLYTAITRAKKSVLVLSPTAVLEHTVLHQHQRQSGLANLF
jgi:exodeoxyribonuclease V alpha subunit